MDNAPIAGRCPAHPAGKNRAIQQRDYAAPKDQHVPVPSRIQVSCEPYEQLLVEPVPRLQGQDKAREPPH